LSLPPLPHPKPWPYRSGPKRTFHAGVNFALTEFSEVPSVRVHFSGQFDCSFSIIGYEGIQDVLK
jgi:hypothetical protein